MADHLHSCFGCHLQSRRTCVCDDPAAPRPCHRRVPGERTVGCVYFYESNAAEAAAINLSGTMRDEYERARKSPPPPNPLIEATRLGLLIYDTAHPERHAPESCAVCDAEQRLRTLRARVTTSPIYPAGDEEDGRI